VPVMMEPSPWAPRDKLSHARAQHHQLSFAASQASQRSPKMLDPSSPLSPLTPWSSSSSKDDAFCMDVAETGKNAELLGWLKIDEPENHKTQGSPGGKHLSQSCDAGSIRRMRSDTGPLVTDSELDGAGDGDACKRPATSCLSTLRDGKIPIEIKRPWRKPKEEVNAERAEADLILTAGSDMAGRAGVDVRALLFCLLAQECLDEHASLNDPPLARASVAPRRTSDSPQGYNSSWNSAAAPAAQEAVDALRQAATNASTAAVVESGIDSVLAAFDTASLAETLRSRTKRPTVGKYDICHRVLPGLWLGGWMALNNDAEELRRRKVTHVVSVVSTQQSCPLPDFIRGHLHILANDSEDAAEGLSAHFPDVCRFVDACRNEPRGIVYIHCGAGISRAPTVAASYLMWKLGISAAEALRLIKRARPNIRPNLGFVKQLRQWEVSMLSLPGGRAINNCIHEQPAILASDAEDPSAQNANESWPTTAT